MLTESVTAFIVIKHKPTKCTFFPTEFNLIFMIFSTGTCFESEGSSSEDSCNKHRYIITNVYTYSTPWYIGDAYAEITLRGFYIKYKIFEL